jgi:hypothetical protein
MNRKKKVKILCVIDWDNIYINVPPPEKFSITAGLDRIMKKIAKEVGEIINVFVFTPPHLALVNAQVFHDEGFYIILCPKIKDKKRGEQDTADEIISAFLQDMINQMPDLTHICLGSGDKDFCRIIRKYVMRRGLKMIIIVGDLISLSGDLMKLADVNPNTGKRMVYVFSPEE